jgi:hypothetical protein
MKAEHRKELQTNALADRIGRFFTGLKSGAKSSSLLLWVIIILVAGGVLVAWLMINKRTKTTRADMLVTLDNLPSMEELYRSMSYHTGKGDPLEAIEDKVNAIVEKNPPKQVKLGARFYLAEIDYRVRGLMPLFSLERGREALESLKKARKTYDGLAEECDGDPYWEPQALMAIAKITETLAVEDYDNLEKARGQYADLVKKYGDSAQGKEAQARLKELRDPDKFATIKKFYTELKRSLLIVEPK